MNRNLMPSPTPEHGLHYTTPATTWDEALPLGNGMMGALVWGDGNPLNISLDRADLWDLRAVPEFQLEEYSFAQMRRWVDEGKAQEISRIYDAPYNRAAPTKIPAGRIELQWNGTPQFENSTLDIREAIASVQFADGSSLRAMLHATQPLGMFVIRGASSGAAANLPAIHLAAPPFSGEIKQRVADGGDYGDLAALGYPAPVETSGENWRAFTQQGYSDFHFAVYVAWQRNGDEWQAAWSVASSFEGAEPLSIARTRVEGALQQGFETVRASHQQWWDEYWSKSSLSLPNKLLETQWYREQYKFGAASRRGAPPITLQGPWTADDGKLPPWKGDFHNDLNTQLSYWPCYSANHLEEGLSFLDWLWEIRPVCQAWTEGYFAAPGLNTPGVTDLRGNAIGGWPQYSFSSTTGAWLAQHFYWHWRYSRDRVFLNERAYPYLAESAAFIEAMTDERDANGKRFLPLSASPEINDNTLAAWFPTITNYDLSLMQWLLAATAELADETGQAEEAAHWRAVFDELPQLAISGDGRLLVAPDVPLHESHRHFSHLMAIYPLGLVNLDGGEEAKHTIAASLAELDRLGPDYWCGYSYSWLGAMHAQARDGEGAERALEIFSTAFTLRNSFHCNGDQTGKGYSTFTYRPFTLEGNFAAAAALQEMLLQSRGGTIRLFPAVPESWADISFTTLRAEGAFLVSAQRVAGKTREVTITAEQDGPCIIESPFSGKLLTFDMTAGQSIVLTQDP